MKKQNSPREIEYAIAAAKVLSEAVEYLVELDSLDKKVYAELGDVGVVNMMWEMKHAMYRAAREVAEEYKEICQQPRGCGGCSLTGYCGGCCGDTSEG